MMAEKQTLLTVNEGESPSGIFSTKRPRVSVLIVVRVTGKSGSYEDHGPFLLRLF